MYYRENIIYNSKFSFLYFGVPLLINLGSIFFLEDPIAEVL